MSPPTAPRPFGGLSIVGRSSSSGLGLVPEPASRDAYYVAGFSKD